MDWRAALWAGLGAGGVFLGLNMWLIPRYIGGNGWVVLRFTASIVLGDFVLPPPATFDPVIVAVGLITHFTLAIVFTLLVAFLLHRWGLIVGILGGALVGLALYAINFYALTYFFPWFFIMRNWIIVLNHVLFGAAAGGIYEALEVEEFVPVDTE